MMDDCCTKCQMGDNSDIQILPDAQRVAPALLHEMMRSFTGLARTLNLSQAVEELGSTRQTVKRHIAHLEDAMGSKLFEVTQRRYILTNTGKRALAPAQLLLDQGEVWYHGQFENVDGLLRFSYKDKNGWMYHQQQQPMGMLWSCKSELLRAALKAWTMSEGQLESPYMEAIRPYIVAYRDNVEGWICVEVGEKSFYSEWYGWAKARSSVGRSLGDFPGGDAVASLAYAPFQDISDGESARVDQVLTMLRFGGEEGPKKHIVFDRLLLGVRLPDGSPAIVSVVDRACKIRIADIDPAVLKSVPDEAKIDFVMQD